MFWWKHYNDKLLARLSSIVNQDPVLCSQRRRKLFEYLFDPMAEMSFGLSNEDVIQMAHVIVNSSGQTSL